MREKIEELITIDHMLFLYESLHDETFRDKIKLIELDMTTGDILINCSNKITINDVIKILAEYYTDEGVGYQSSIGDMVYMCFTDMVEDEYDILSEVEENVS